MDLFVAKQAMIVTIDGYNRAIRKGAVVRAGHPIMKGRERLFEPLKVDYDVEQATAAPGEKRSVTRPKAKPHGSD